jgi:hypothetical protein
MIRRPLRPSPTSLRAGRPFALVLLALTPVLGCCLRPFKCLESRVIDEIARQVEAECRRDDFDGIGEFEREAARDVWQRTIQYDVSADKQRGHLLHIRCAQDGDYPAGSQMPDFWYESGWNPGECASKYSNKGCPPDDWQVPDNGWLEDYQEEWESRNCPSAQEGCPSQ